jgi:hypothetical protein
VVVLDQGASDGAADAPEFWALLPGEARLMTCRTKISFP